MLTIRLQRTGKKGQPYFRVVLIEHTHKVGGAFKEILGFRNPRTKEVSLKGDRIQYWLSQGVKASPTVHNLFVSQGIISTPKVKAWKPKKRKGDAPSSSEKGKDTKPEESGEQKTDTTKTEEKKEGVTEEKKEKKTEEKKEKVETKKEEEKSENV